MKKRISMAIAVATAAAMMTGAAVPVMADDVNITIFNSKMEIQSQFEEKAAEYTEETGVGVEVYYNSDTVSAHLATRYSANDPYTISMVDPKDIYSLAADHAIDLSDQSWVNETDYAIGVDGQINGFPTCLEARGLIYNADAIEAITGETFNPDDYKTLDSFKELLEKLPPFLTGGEMIESVTREGAVWAEVPHKFEAGTVNAGGAYALAEAVRYMKNIGFDAIEAQENRLTRIAYEGMMNIPGIRVLGSSDPDNHHGILSFAVDGVHPT